MVDIGSRDMSHSVGREIKTATPWTTAAWTDVEIEFPALTCGGAGASPVMMAPYTLP
jgi:hypothetical protein